MKLPKSESKYGYTKEELDKWLKEENICESCFWTAFGVNTCAFIKGKPRYYTCDVERTLHKLGHKLGVNYEWD